MDHRPRGDRRSQDAGTGNARERRGAPARIRLADDLRHPDHHRLAVGRVDARGRRHHCHRHAFGRRLRDEAPAESARGRPAGDIDQPHRRTHEPDRRGVAGGCQAAASAGFELKYSVAAVTPPERCGTPRLFRPISTPVSVAVTIMSWKSPMWPMRNILSATFPSPAPSDMLLWARMWARSLSAE